MHTLNQQLRSTAHRTFSTAALRCSLLAQIALSYIASSQKMEVVNV